MTTLIQAMKAGEWVGHSPKDTAKIVFDGVDAFTQGHDRLHFAMVTAAAFVLEHRNTDVLKHGIEKLIRDRHRPTAKVVVRWMNRHLTIKDGEVEKMAIKCHIDKNYNVSVEINKEEVCDLVDARVLFDNPWWEDEAEKKDPPQYNFENRATSFIKKDIEAGAHTDKESFLEDLGNLWDKVLNS